jgi:hypothetical protein
MRSCVVIELSFPQHQCEGEAQVTFLGIGDGVLANQLSKGQM